MNLFVQVLAKLLEKEEMVVTCPNLTLSAAELVEMRCFLALQEIKAIMTDDISDPECFKRIEMIISTFEELGSGCGPRHDF